VKPQVYKDPRPPELFTRHHERQRRKRPNWIYDVSRLVLTPIMLLFWRARAIDADRVPAQGPAIITPNHFSFLDHFFVAMYLRRKVQFMAKSQLFTNPIITWIFHNGGVFPVRRGHRDEEAFITARTVLGRGDLVVMYAEGGRSRSGQLGQPKSGVGRLALETGVPVVPTAVAGSQKARNWKRLQFPKVTVHYGEPIRFERVEEPTREQAQAAAEIVFERVRALYDGLRQHGRRATLKAARSAAEHRASDAAEAAARRPLTR
jgi:1-acyl-sn-glycerol-3-phosphate acyltransferase